MHPRLSLLAVAVAFVVLAASCGSSQIGSSSTPAEPYPLGPEMAQLEKDLVWQSYRDGVLAMRNYNDLNGEIGRIDVPDNARRFAARHSAVSRVPALTTAYERRLKIERDFLDLMLQAYRGLDREALYHEQVEKLFTETRRPAAAAGAARIEPILPVPGAEKHWPRWRGPSGQGHSSASGLPVEWSVEGELKNIAWRTPIPGSGNSSPIIWGDRVFITTAFDRGMRRSLVSVDRGSGELLWVMDAPFVEAEGRVMRKNGYASATPATDGERVVTFFGNTGMVAFDFDGNVLWHHPMGPFNAHHGTGASPVLYGDLAIVFQEQSGAESVGVAVDKRTGDVRWSVKSTPAYGWCTPLPIRVNGRDLLLYGSKHALRALDPSTGDEIWRTTGPTHEVVPTVAYGHGLVFSTSGRNGPTLAVRPDGEGDVSETHVAWSVRRGGPHVPSPALVGDLLYLVQDRGILTCLEARTGKTVYQTRLGGAFSASPLAADGKLYFTSESGDTTVVRPGREFETIAVNAFGESTLASMAALDGTLYARTAGHLIAIREAGR